MMPQNINLRDAFNALPKDVQENVTNFFNCHNVAISLFNQMPQEGQDYITCCINMTHEANKIEDHPE